MELLQLQYFRTVARLEHMTKAAEELRVAQPALSKTIARLEEDLGVPLFDRQGRQIKLNPFGRAFLEKTEAALTALEEGRRQLADMAGMDGGSVRIASPAVNRLSGPAGEFLKANPRIKFHLQQTSVEEMIRLLEESRIDFGFTGLPVDRPGITELAVLEEEVYLIVPPGHRLAGSESVDLREVEGEQLIGYERGHVFRKRDDELFRRAGIVPAYACEVNEPAAKISLIRAGLGVSLIGACSRSDDAPALHPMMLIRVRHPECRSTFRLVWQEHHYFSKAALAFRDYLQAYYKEKQGNRTEAEGAAYTQASLS